MKRNFTTVTRIFRLFCHRVLTERIFGVANHPLSPPSANSRVYLKKNFALKYLALIAQW